MTPFWYEDFEIGAVFPLGSYTFTRERIIAFAHEFDPQTFHLSDEAAVTGPFGRLTASGFHTAAGWMKCYMETYAKARAEMQAKSIAVPDHGPSPGFRNLKWIRPVYVDDTVSYSTRIKAKSLHPRRAGWGVIESLNEGMNQNGELVYAFEGRALWAVKG